MHVLLGVLMLAVAAPEDAVHMRLVPEGAASTMGSYSSRLTLTEERPTTLRQAPPDLTAPMYGILKMAGPAGAVYHLVVDEPEDGEARLFVDANGNGDLTDDPAATWHGKPGGKDGERELKQYSGGAMVNLGETDAPYSVNLIMYRFDKTDPRRAAVRDVLFYYRDYGLEGEVELGGRTYRVMLNDALTTGDFRGAAPAAAPAGNDTSGVFFMIDVNENGKFERRGETYDVRTPFNIGGTTYEIAEMERTGLSFKVVTSEQTVPEVAVAPDHSLGKKVTAFEAVSTDGGPVKFPGDYKGKVVMIDFWATWCGPCMAEVPGLVRVYNRFHDRGFEILGVSLDNEKSVAKLKPVTEEKGMAWKQVCDGKGWQAEVAQLYAVEGIPACWLVDGDTGEILATEGSLRGATLEGTIERALRNKSEKN